MDYCVAHETENKWSPVGGGGGGERQIRGVTASYRQRARELNDLYLEIAFVQRCARERYIVPISRSIIVRK